MTWDFKNLALALGCTEESSNYRGGLLNYEMPLVIKKGKKAGIFELYDEYDEYGEPLIINKFSNIAHVKGTYSYNIIEFKDGGSVSFTTLDPKGLILSFELEDYKGNITEGTQKKSFNIKESVKIPGTDIILEKGDKIYVKEAEEVLFRATTRGGRDFFEIKKTTLEDGTVFYDFSSSNSGGGGNEGKLSLGQYVGEMLSPDVTFDKIAIDKLGIGNIIKDTYKAINSKFGYLKKTSKGSKEHQLWFAVWRTLRGQLMRSDADTASELKSLIKKTFDLIEDKLSEKLN